MSVLALAGCGAAGGREQAAVAAAQRLLTAVDDGDGVQACAVLAPKTIAELEQSSGEPCSQAILEQQLPRPGSACCSRSC